MLFDRRVVEERSFTKPVSQEFYDASRAYGFSGSGIGRGGTWDPWHASYGSHGRSGGEAGIGLGIHGIEVEGLEIDGFVDGLTDGGVGDESDTGGSA
ncbi:hypothetical protein Dimus_036066, partial [Dionaea muscipula]